MTISAGNIEIQSIHRISTTISNELIKDAILAAYEESNRTYDFNVSVNIRIVGREEGTEINKKFKKKNAPTNVLAFVGDPEKENKLGIEASIPNLFSFSGSPTKARTFVGAFFFLNFLLISVPSSLPTILILTETLKS